MCVCGFFWLALFHCVVDDDDDEDDNEDYTTHEHIIIASREHKPKTQVTLRWV